MGSSSWHVFFKGASGTPGVTRGASEKYRWDAVTRKHGHGTTHSGAVSGKGRARREASVRAVRGPSCKTGRRQDGQGDIWIVDGVEGQMEKYLD